MNCFKCRRLSQAGKQAGDSTQPASLRLDQKLKQKLGAFGTDSGINPASNQPKAKRKQTQKQQQQQPPSTQGSRSACASLCILANAIPRQASCLSAALLFGLAFTYMVQGLKKMQQDWPDAIKALLSTACRA